MDLEVDTNLVLNRRIKLRVVDGSIISGALMVYECEEPYVLIITVTPDIDNQAFLMTSDDDIIRLDVFKDDLSRELKHWMEGKYIHHPAAMVPTRIEEGIMRFVKYAKTPKQEDLIMWILSRCELHKANHIYDLVFGGITLDDEGYGYDMDLQKSHIHNQFNKTATLAAGKASNGLGDGSKEGNKNKNTSSVVRGPLTQATASFQDTLFHTETNEDMGMFSLTKKLLGHSQTLTALKTQKVKGRAGAKQVLNGTNFPPETLKYVTEIERSRQDIMDKMDERRRYVEVAKIRQATTHERYRIIQSEVREKKKHNQVLATALQELTVLQTIEKEIEEDMKRQHVRIQRGVQTAVWTKAPAAYPNLRGKSQKGPVLGRGPLPPSATTKLKDPIIEQTIKRFYWDREGRRHVREKGRESDMPPLLTQCLEAIRSASSRLSLYKLDLLSVFKGMDTSGDGYISPAELAQALLSMGVKVDAHTMQQLWSHFDPNESGSVHYGEFLWAFFNRRNLLKQWKTAKKKMDKSEIVQRFHSADRNGNGTLNRKEFAKILKSFSITLPEGEITIIMDRFDIDGDGEIDFKEFLSFLEDEEQGGQPADASRASRTTPTARSTSPSPPPRSSNNNNNKHHLTAPNANQKQPQARPQSAPRASASTSRGLVSTAPADLQKHRRVVPTTTSTTSVSTGGVAVEEGSVDDDVLWMSRMLQAQSEVEGRLGNSYYRVKTR